MTITTAEREHLTQLAATAFDNIEWYNSIGYTLFPFGVDTLKIVSGRSTTEEPSEPQEEPQKYEHFRASALYEIARDELQRYVLSDKFRLSYTRQYIAHEIQEGEAVPCLSFDGRENIDLDNAFEVRNYLIEISRIAGKYEHQETFRDWFTQQFLQIIPDQNTYVRSSCQTLLHSSRLLSFDDALGFEMETILNPHYLQEKAVRNFKSLTVGEDTIQNQELYDLVLQRATVSPESALLFSVPVIQFLAYQAVTHPAQSIHAVRFKAFLECSDHRVIDSFTNYTPYPFVDIVALHEGQAEFNYYWRQRELFRPIHEAYNFPLRCISDFSLLEPTSPENKVQNRILLERSGALRKIKWHPKEQKLFSRKVVSHLLNDSKALNRFEDSQFQYPECWPEIIELLRNGYNGIFLDSLQEEIRTRQPQRLENIISPKLGLTPERVRFTSESYPARTIEVAGEQYQLEIDRSLISVMNTLGNREDRDQTWDDCAIPAVVRVVSDLDHQFISVHTMGSRTPEHIGSVWLDGSTRLSGKRLDYYDEIPSGFTNFVPLRAELMKYAEEFALYCGYTKLEFDSNDLITPAEKKAL